MTTLTKVLLAVNFVAFASNLYVLVTQPSLLGVAVVAFITASSVCVYRLDGRVA